VARITVPRRCVGRSRLTESETGELDEHHFNRDVAAARNVERVLGAARESKSVVRIAVAEVGELEVALTEGTDNAVFGGGAGINRQRHTRTGEEVIAVAIALARVAVIRRIAIGAVAGAERGIDTQIAAQLDAGVGARDIEETRTIQGADPHVLDRFGLDG